MSLMCVQYHAYCDAYVLDDMGPTTYLPLSLKVTLRPSNVQAYIGLQQLLSGLKEMQVRTPTLHTLGLHSIAQRRLGPVQVEHGSCFMAQRSR